MLILPPSAALLLVDLQKGFRDPYWGRRNNPEMESRIFVLLRAWRASERPIFHARHMSTVPLSPLRPGQSGNEFMELLAPAWGERVVEKRVHSSFIDTSLREDLRWRGCGTVVIVGLTTNHCVSTTARMANNLGFDVWVVSDGTATFDRMGPDGALRQADHIHASALSDLHGEFATVVDTATVLAAATAREPRRIAGARGA